MRINSHEGFSGRLAKVSHVTFPDDCSVKVWEKGAIASFTNSS